MIEIIDLKNYSGSLGTRHRSLGCDGVAALTDALAAVKSSCIFLRQFPISLPQEQ
jgi:hypothetical protein